MFDMECPTHCTCSTCRRDAVHAQWKERLSKHRVYGECVDCGGIFRVRYLSEIIYKGSCTCSECDLPF